MLKYLGLLWAKYPDYRLGQLCWIIAGRDPFHFEMDEFLRFCESKGVEVDWAEIPEQFVEPDGMKEFVEQLPEVLKKIKGELNSQIFWGKQ